MKSPGSTTISSVQLRRETTDPNVVEVNSLLLTQAVTDPVAAAEKPIYP